MLLYWAPVSANAEVTPGGQFQATVSVVVPAFHNIEPKLTLTYTSTQTNGWLGAGWSLSGGPSYIAQVSKSRGVPRRDGSDIFTLDGLELIPCQPQSTSPSCSTAVAAFGNSNGFYSTKTDTFRRIQYVSTGNLWHVWDTNGRRRDYTLDADDTRWCLTADTDTHGNQVTYRYQVLYGPNSSVSDSYLYEIAYPGQGNDPNLGAHIRFYYDTRPDVVTYGVGTHLDSEAKRLLAIDVLFGGKRLRTYALTYHSSNATAASLLDSIQQFGSDATVNCGAVTGDSCDSSLPQGKVTSGTTLPAKTLTYDESGGGSFQSVATALDSVWPTFAGDFDGDGKTDYVEVNQRFTTHLSNGDGTFRIVNTTPIPAWCQESLAWNCFSSGSSALVGDFNGDGKTDFISLAQNINVFLSKGDGTFQVISSPPPAFCNGQAASACLLPPQPGMAGTLNGSLPSAYRTSRALAAGEIITGDFNGDGKTDFLVAKDNFYSFLSNGDGTFQIVTMKPPGYCTQASSCLSSIPNHIVIGDIDGDGKIDFISADTNFDVFRSNGDGTFQWIPIPPPSSCTDGTQTTAALCLDTVTTIVGDFNGDGKIDVASEVNHNGHVANNVFLSNGNGSFTIVAEALPPVCTPNGGATGCLATGPHRLVVGDFNGDGKTDFISVNTNFDMWLSTGSGNFTHRTVSAGASCPVATQCVLRSTPNVTSSTASPKLATTTTGAGNGDPTMISILDPGENAAVVGANPGVPVVVSGTYNAGATKGVRIGVSLGGKEYQFPPTDPESWSYSGLTETGGAITIWATLYRGGVALATTSVKVTVNNNPPLQGVGGLVVGDFNGDGKADILSNSMWLATGGPTDHLIAAANGYGITTSVSYVSSSHFPSNYLPVGTVFQAVAAVETSDGNTLADTHSYSYSAPKWDFTENRFLGFSTTRETIDKAGTVVQTTYNQTSACFIQPAKVSTMDASGNIYALTDFQYVAAGSIPYDCQLFSETRYEAEGTCNSEAACAQSTTARAIGTYLYYDSYGNLTQKVEQGDIKLQGDERTTALTYEKTPNAASYIVNAPLSRQLSPGTGSGQPLRATAYTYDGVGGIPTKGDVTTRGDYVAQNPLAIVLTNFTYDTFGNRTSSTVMGQSTTTSFDPTYNVAPVKTCNALNQCTNTTWDIGLGLRIYVTDPNGAQTFYSYDPLGRITKVIESDKATTQYQYFLVQDAAGHTTGQRIRSVVTDGTTDGLWVDSYLDGLGRTYRTVRKNGTERDVQFADATMNPSADSGWFLSSASPQWTSFTYDGLKRMVTLQHPDTTSRTKRYTVGQITQIDELSHDRSFFTDAYGRTTGIKEHNGTAYASTSYTFDAADQLSQIQDANGNTSTITRDGLGRAISTNDPDLGVWQYALDDVGNVRNRKDANGQTLSYTYDALNRPTVKVYPDGSQTKFRYDESGHGAGTGRRTGITDLDPMGNVKSTSDFTYDSRGRVTSWKKCRSAVCVTLNSAFDIAGRLSSITYPDANGAISSASETVTYGYDSNGMITSVTGSSPYLTQATWDPTGLPLSMTYLNGTTTTNTYDPRRHWLLSASVTGPSAASLYQATYGYDAAGRITSYNPRAPLTYSYDDLNRLIQKTDTENDHGNEVFTYDAIGNIASSSALGWYSYTASGCPSGNTCASHPHAVTKAGNNTYTYDANGDMISGAGRTFTWNSDNLPTSVSASSGVTTFHYDGDNSLVATTAPGSQQPTYYFGPLVERTPSGAFIYSYFMGSTLIARRSTSTTWYHRDHVESVRLITNAQASAAQIYNYSTYGVTGAEPTQQLDEFGFTSQRRNPSTAVTGQDSAGLIYMNARFYDATLGRFISPDTVIPEPNNPQSLNRYTYARNNPISYSDPTGHDAQSYFSSDSYNPEDPFRYNHRTDPWASVSAPVQKST
jgi:RHS repeat-associated protein